MSIDEHFKFLDQQQVTNTRAPVAVQSLWTKMQQSEQSYLLDI